MPERRYENIGRNIWFSLASTAIISACIFYSVCFALVANVQYMVKNAETTVGITVFFDENMAEADILAIGKEIAARKEIKETKYISAEGGMETFQKEYFKDAGGTGGKALRMITRWPDRHLTKFI